MAKYGYSSSGHKNGGNNMNALMAQAQAMQAQMRQAQDQLTASVVTGSVSGGLVEVTMNGAKEITAVKIKPEAVDPDDVEMLEDLIMAAIGDATNQVNKLSEEIMGPFSSILG